MAKHPAVEFINDDRRECRTCGRGVIGSGPTLRHVGEVVRPVFPAPADAAVFDRALHVAEAALERLWSQEQTSEDRARVVVEAIYEDGLLRKRPPARPVAATG